MVKIGSYLEGQAIEFMSRRLPIEELIIARRPL